MFFVSTFHRVWKWHRQFSQEQPSERHSPKQVVSAVEEMRWRSLSERESRKHHSLAVSEFQKVKRNHFLERKAFF